MKLSLTLLSKVLKSDDIIDFSLVKNMKIVINGSRILDIINYELKNNKNYQEGRKIQFKLIK